MFDITKHSKQLKVKTRSSKSEVNDEKQMFIDLVETFELLNKRSLSVEEEHGLKLEKYDGLFYLLIENLFYVHFGEWQTEIILWYVYERKNIFGDENDYAKLYNSKSGKEIDITSTEKFWFLIQEIVNNTVKVDDLEVIGLEEEEEDEDDEEEE